jgi:type VI secretion system protein ImpA
VSESDQSSAVRGAVAAPEQPSALDPVVAALCIPIAEADPCGPDLDSEGDADYLNFFAQVDGILPTSFFSPEDGKPFDPSTTDINGQLAAIEPLLARSRDIRLLSVRARLLILRKDLVGFAVAIAAIAEWLERFWDSVHPRPQNGNLDARVSAISTLDLPTVVFPLQYTPLLEGRRIGTISYRSWMIGTGEIKPRAGDPTVAAAAITEAIDGADPEILAVARRHIALLNTSIDRIRRAFALHGSSSGLESLPALVGKIVTFIDPNAAATTAEAVAAETGDGVEPRAKRDAPAVKAAGPPPTSIVDATEALAAIAVYYSQSEPSSPTLPLVRQAHQLIGKSFLEVMTILMPLQVEKAAFQIGAEQVFDLPVGKLSSLSGVAPAGAPPPGAGSAGEPTDPVQPADPPRHRYRVESRSQAIALLDQVQRYFRHSEPSSPVPMLCERARALAERDFMGVLRDVLPKSAFKNTNVDK